MAFALRGSCSLAWALEYIPELKCSSSGEIRVNAYLGRAGRASLCCPLRNVCCCCRGSCSDRRPRGNPCSGSKHPMWLMAGLKPESELGRRAVAVESPEEKSWQSSRSADTDYVPWRDRAI